MNLRCILGHLWGLWTHHHHQGEEWYERKCERCGKLQQRTISG